MRVIPKIAEYDFEYLESYEDIVTDAIEIQLLSKKFSDSLKNITEICRYFKKLNYVVLHLPFKCLNIGHIHSCHRVELDFILFVVKIMELGNILNINFDILFHLNNTGEEFEDSGGVEFLEYLCNLVENSKVSFLLENSIRSLNIHLNEIDNVSYVFQKIRNEKLGFCLDVCHLQASENVYATKFDLSFECLNALKNIHFSKTLNNDGYRDKKKTHGRVHLNKEDVLKDLRYLEEKGISLENINMVLEISEDDYINRPDLKYEFLIFKELMQNG